MCGIFGVIIKSQSVLPSNSIASVLNKLAALSESRGKDSSGLAFRMEDNNTIQVLKGDIPIRQLLKSREFKLQLKNGLTSYSKGNGFTAFGHARLVTNGSQLHEANNQPVLKDNIIIIHNGIVVNVDELWQKNPDIQRNNLIDTEILPALIRKELNQKVDLANACSNAFNQVEGTYSVAVMFQDLNQFVLASNNGSLYFMTDSKEFIIFASESFYLGDLRKSSRFSAFGKNTEIQQIRANTGVIINFVNLEISPFNIQQDSATNPKLLLSKTYQLQKHLIENNSFSREVVIDPLVFFNRSENNQLFKLLEHNKTSIGKLKRCTKCLLPETFPFIEYDHLGVCNYCNNYKQTMQNENLDALKELVKPYRHKDGTPDCIIPYSGGRDSTYTLHIVKKELGLNPIAYTYDWGMVTDLARRNIARVCGKIGVENIIVSANIKWKRENIRKNINAWLKKPQLGMVPLFMAGDKFFFYYCNKVKRQTGIDLNIWGINPLENTEFKTGFAGLSPDYNKKRIYSLSFQNQVRLFKFVTGSVIKSPGYLNQSVLDSLGSYAARYLAPKRDYFQLFDYYKWDEKEINNILKYEYNWESAIDTKSTWRIGDGTASFYNYIYYTVAGFSENDTFRSNQIREGMLGREEALLLTEEDNTPRYETLRWYCEIIGLDFEMVIKKINSIPKLYRLEW